MVDTFELPSPLGAWVTSSHRIWEWRIHENGTMMYRSREDGSYDKYVKRGGRGCKFHRALTVNEMERYSPISVKIIDENFVRLNSTAALVSEEKMDYDSF